MYINLDDEKFILDSEGKPKKDKDKGVAKSLGHLEKVLDIADQVTGALENVPVLNEAVGIARPLIKDGKVLLEGVNRGLITAHRVNNKIGRITQR